MTILEKIKFEEDWLSEVNLTKENIKIAFAGIRATALESQRWIPVSERLPEEYIHVLCQFTLGGMGECYLAHGVFHVVGGLVMTCNEVIAWMPLPKPYEESEDKVIHNHPCEDCYYNDDDLHAECVVCDKPLEQQPCEYEPFTIAEVSPEMRKLMEEWQQPCDDCVSRKAVNKLKKYRLSYDTNTTIPKADIFVKISDIAGLPSVKPSRPKGKWIPIHPLQEDDDGAYICSNCEYGDWDCDTIYKYCPFCGAQMNGGGEDEND